MTRFLPLVLVGALVVSGLGWIGGELHRENCQRDGHLGCTVLPWDNGHTASAKPQGADLGPTVDEITGVTVDCLLGHTPCP